MSAAKIDRSPGVIAEVNGRPAGFLAGGGYRGATVELDALVEQAAEVLVSIYDMPVTIRFNSDRESGGAWLRTHERDRIGANAARSVSAPAW